MIEGKVEGRNQEVRHRPAELIELNIFFIQDYTIPSNQLKTGKTGITPSILYKFQFCHQILSKVNGWRRKEDTVFQITSSIIICKWLLCLFEHTITNWTQKSSKLPPSLFVVPILILKRFYPLELFVLNQSCKLIFIVTY